MKITGSQAVGRREMAVELTTIVRVDGADATVLPELAANLEAALVEAIANLGMAAVKAYFCLLYTSPSPRDVEESRMPSSA